MIRRLLSYFFGCSVHGSWDVPDSAVTIYGVRCNLPAFHDGRHDFDPHGVAGLGLVNGKCHCETRALATPAPDREP